MAAIREDSSLLFTFHFPATVGFFTLHFTSLLQLPLPQYPPPRPASQTPLP